MRKTTRRHAIIAGDKHSLKGQYLYSLYAEYVYVCA